MAIDYRDLLKRYMDHVGACEGVCFVYEYKDGHMGEGFHGSKVPFTEEEVDELITMFNELR